MTKRQRTALFAILLISFLVVTPIIILYSQGYRFDWVSKKITQTGAFYFKVVPARADVYLNGTLVKKTDFFFDSVLLGDLVPKSYFVRIQKEGYIPWTKSLPIKPKEVTEAKNIILFPSRIDFKSVLEGVQDFWPSPDKKKVVFEKPAPSSQWQLYLWNLQTNDQTFISRQKGKEPLKEAVWSQDSSNILIGNSVLNLEGGPGDQCVKMPCDLKSFMLGHPNALFMSQEQATRQTLLKFDVHNTIEKKIGSPNAIVLSPDKKKIAIANGSEIWIYYVEDQNDQPIKKAGDLELLKKFNGQPSNLLWIDDRHLAFAVGNSLKTTEIDKRDSLNIADIATFSSTPKFFWQDQDKTLTVLSEGTVSVSEKVIR